MMRRDVRSVPASMTLAEFCARYPLGSGNRVIATDAAGAYAGIVWVADAHAAPPGTTRLTQLLHHEGAVLIPGMSVKEAVQLFASAEADALAVVDDLKNRHVQGILTEQHALRRYTEELDKRRRDISGE
jgi:CIC family chloride channel protein